MTLRSPLPSRRRASAAPDGEAGAGLGKVTIKEVAKLAGVHPGTASRALSAATRGMVNEQTARRVEEAARQLRYRPNHSARSLKTRRSDTIGVLIPDLTNPLFPPIVRGIEDRLALAGYVAVIGNTDNDEEREALVFERMRDRHVDGFILATARRRRPVPADPGELGEPVVLVNRTAEDGAIPSVSVDDPAGIRALVEHLTALGHRRMAHVAGPQSLSTGHGRYVALVQAAGGVGAEVTADDVAFAERFSEAEGYRCAMELLHRRRHTAVLAANDSLALGVLRAAEELGMDCPGELSVTGFNDMAFVDRVRPPLTTVRVPQYQLGYQAAQLVLERLSDDPAVPTKAVLLRPELVVRESTGPAVTLRAGPPSSRRRKVGAGS